MVQDLWDTRTAILIGVPIPGTRPRLRKQRFYAVTEGDSKGVYESYAEVQLKHCKAVSFSSHNEAQAFVDGYQVPVRVDLDQCTAPDLVIFTDGSYTPSGSKPCASSGVWTTRFTFTRTVGSLSVRIAALPYPG